jgi:predicted metal-dependent hydrolase
MTARYLANEPLPAFTYVPGRTPRPPKDAPAHPSAGEVVVPPPFDPARWRESREFLRGVDLFNCGFYWEAHEEWERLWHAAGRSGPTADFLKGLIKLAAAGVKAYERRPAGVRRHAQRALELWKPLAGPISIEPWHSLALREVLVLASRALAAADDLARSPHSPPMAGLLGRYAPG